MTLRTLFATSALAFASCGGEESHFGDRCTSNGACGSGGFCCEGRECPGGFCTELCETDDTCPVGTVCIELLSRDRVCLVGCSVEEDCDEVGTDMECREREGARVCLNDGG